MLAPAELGFTDESIYQKDNSDVANALELYHALPNAVLNFNNN